MRSFRKTLTLSKEHELLKLGEDRNIQVISTLYETPEEVSNGLDYFDDLFVTKNINQRIIGFDTETTGLRPESENEELRLLQIGVQTDDLNVFEAFLFDCWSLEDDAVERIAMVLADDKIVKVGQNLKFDIKFWKKFYHSRFPFGFRFGKLFDTHLAAQILAFGYKGQDFKLATIAENWLGIELHKEEALSDWSKPYLSDAQLEYAGLDSVVPVLIREAMYPTIRTEGLVTACATDFGAVEPVARLEYDGFYLNEKRWVAEYHKTIEDRDTLKSEICEMLPSGQPKLFEDIEEFNLSSTKQLAYRLSLQGISLPQTAKGNPSRDAFLMEQIIDEHPSIPKLIQYAKLEKLLSAYGLNWLEDINETTKRVHPSFNINGALATSRFSSFNPNLQQIPRGDSRRSCFEATKGNILVDADYSQIELRILAQFSKDEVFISGFSSGIDFHTWTASEVFERDPDDVTKDQREFAKRLNFGLVYGIGAEKLGLMLGIPEEEASALMKRYFEKFAKTDAYLRQASQQAIRYKRTSTATGRYVKYHFSRTDRFMASSVGRSGKNMPIQGTSAEILKTALNFLGENLYGRNDIKLVNIVHDEIILEAPEKIKEEAREILFDSMKRGAERFLTRVPVKIDIDYMKLWSKG